jgi:hypothetical protein
MACQIFVPLGEFLTVDQIRSYAALFSEWFREGILVAIRAAETSNSFTAVVV